MSKTPLEELKEVWAENARRVIPLTDDDMALAKWAKLLERQSKDYIQQIIQDARKVLE